MYRPRTVLESFKLKCHKYLVIKDDKYIDIIFAVIFANRLDSKPVWMYLVGAPSSGKTEILQALVGPEVEQISKLSAHSLNSGYVDPKNKLADFSLLPKIDGKTIIIKDFTALLNSRSDTLMEITGQLRDAYDGSSRSVFGTGKDVTYKSKFGIIAGVTNAIDRHRAVLTELGERFLTYRCPVIDVKESYARCWKVSSPKEVTKQEADLKAAATKVLALKMHRVTLSDSFRRKIIHVAEFVARARTEVTRDRFSKEPEIPMPEVATRLTRQLCDFAIGLAVVHEKKYITSEILRIVEKVALDCLTLKRLRLLRILYEKFPQYMSTAEVATAMKFSKTIIRRWLDDLYLLELIDKSGQSDQEHESVSWRTKYKNLLNCIWKKENK